MNERQQQFLQLYQALRHEDQARFYQARQGEFEKAHTQAVILAAVLMALTSIVSFLTPMKLIEQKWVWVLAVLAVFLPALSAALTAYNSLYSFEPQAKLYHDALLALHKAKASGVDAEQAPEAEAEAKLAAYVSQVEEIFHKEQGQWGQLISELKPVQAPTAAQRINPAPAPAAEKNKLPNHEASHKG